MRLSTFKILLLIIFCPTVHTEISSQTVSRAEHCLALEEKVNIKPELHESYVTVYLHHLQQCQANIENQFQLYKKLLDQVLKSLPRASSMEATSRVVQTLLDQISKPDLNSLSEIAHEPWQELSQRIQEDQNILVHISVPLNYNFLQKPLLVLQNIQTLDDVPLHAVEMTQNFSSQFSICTNTEEFQHLLKPLHHFLQNLIFLFTRSINENQMYSFQKLYKIYHTLHVKSGEPSRSLDFISWLQLPLPFIDFLSQSVDWTAQPFENSYKWLEPLLPLLKLHKQVEEKINNHCVAYQPFLKTHFVEYHYIAQFLENNTLSEERRHELLQMIHENLREGNNDFFFHSTIPSNKQSIYLYFLKLYSTPE